MLGTGWRTIVTLRVFSPEICGVFAGPDVLQNGIAGQRQCKYHASGELEEVYYAG
jgi:hypothetical protein